MFGREENSKFWDLFKQKNGSKNLPQTIKETPLHKTQVLSLKIKRQTCPLFMDHCPHKTSLYLKSKTIPGEDQIGPPCIFVL